MEILNPHNTITLPSDYNNRPYGIAFDGRFFCLTVPQECSVYKFKCDFTMIGSLTTNQPYNCICYDNTENCFWVTADKHTDVIYKLDCNLKEIDMIKVKNCPKDCSKIVGLTYNCEKDTLLIAYNDYIVEVSKESACACIVQKTRGGIYTAVLSISPYYAVVRQDEKSHEFQIFTCDGCQIKSFCIPDFYNIKDVIFYPCNECCLNELEFILLAAKHNRYPKVLFCKVDACDMTLCCCNYEVCCTHCGEEDKNEQCICDVIESIALVETSLAHILNAEGEKLQKAVELSDSIDELLAINKSVTKTIINITQLEHNLYLKMDALNDLCKRPIIINNEE